MEYKNINEGMDLVTIEDIGFYDDDTIGELSTEEINEILTDAGFELEGYMEDLSELYGVIIAEGGMGNIDEELSGWLRRALRKAKKGIKKVGRKVKKALKKITLKKALPIVVGAVIGGVGGALLTAGKKAVNSIKKATSDPEQALKEISQTMSDTQASLSRASVKLGESAEIVAQVAVPENQEAIILSAKNPQYNLAVIDDRLKMAGVPGGMIGGLVMLGLVGAVLMAGKKKRR